MRKNKKGYALEFVPTVVVLLGVIAIVIGLNQTILTNIASTQDANSYAVNATYQGQQGLDTFSKFQPTIAIVVVASVILTIIGAVLLRKVM